MRILLAGHEGYVGAGLLAYFRRSHQVLGWGRKEDLLELDAATLERERIELVVNCAAVIDRETAAFEAGSPSDRVNVGGARRLAELLRGTGIGWFQISTREVFGPVYGPGDVLDGPAGKRPAFLVEDDRPFDPRNAYAKSKLIAELVAESHARCNVIRLSTCYTDLDHPRGGWVLKLIKAALRGEAAPVTADGRQFRDPLHCDDLGRLIEELAARGAYGHKLNAGGGPENVISLRELLELAVPGARVSAQPGGDHGFAFSNRRASELGWAPRVRVRERLPVLVANARAGLARSLPA